MGRKKKTKSFLGSLCLYTATSLMTVHIQPSPPSAPGLVIPPAWLLEPRALHPETWSLHSRPMGTATACIFSCSAGTKAKQVPHTDTHCLTHCTSIDRPSPLRLAQTAGIWCRHTHTFKIGYYWLANINEEDALTLHIYLHINHSFGPTHLSKWSKFRLTKSTWSLC